MKDEIVYKIILIIVSILAIVLNIAGRADGYKEGYKQGQIDALSKNKIVYCLKDDELNQSTWKLCKEE